MIERRVRFHQICGLTASDLVSLVAADSLA